MGKTKTEIALFLFYIIVFYFIVLYFICVCACACSEVENQKFCSGQVNLELHDELGIRDVGWQLDTQVWNS